MSYRPVDVSWIAERCPEVKEALSHYLKGEISYEDTLKLAIASLYKSLISVQLELSEYQKRYEYWHGKAERLMKNQEEEAPYLSEDTLARLRKGELLP